jgi:hypothetical protein
LVSFPAIERRKQYVIQFPLTAILVAVFFAAAVFAAVNDGGLFGAALLFDLTLIFLLTAVLALPGRTRPGQAFALGLVAFGTSHLLLLLLELSAMGRGLVLNWQLITYFADRAGWFSLTETTASPARPFVLALVAVNLWGLFGGLLALVGNARKPPDRV